MSCEKEDLTMCWLKNCEFLQTERENEHTSGNKSTEDSEFGGVWKNSALEIVRTMLQVSLAIEETSFDYYNEEKMTSVGKAI